MRVSKGFTLIELMIVIVIVAILVGVALPSYQASVSKTRRAEAKEFALKVAHAQERHYTQYLRYADTITGTAAADNLGWATADLDSASGYYSLDTAGSTFTATGYTIQIKPVAGKSQADDICGSFKVTHTGVKSYTGTSGSKEQCW